MRILPIIGLVFILSGCSVVDFLFGCSDCALGPDDVSFQDGDQDGLLAFGLTVDAPVASGESLAGSLGWLVETDDDLLMREVAFPDDLQPGQHRLIVWRVPAGIWSLRHARLGQGRGSSLSDVFNNQAAATLVRPGHITIAGEIRIQGGGKPIVRYNLESAFVRKELQTYPDISAPSDEMPLVDMRKHK